MYKTCFLKLTFIVPMLFLSLVVLSQEVIRGKITDTRTGEVLLGVTVMIEGTSAGTVADVDGDFSLKIPKKGMWFYFSEWWVIRK